MLSKLVLLTVALSAPFIASASTITPMSKRQSLSLQCNIGDKGTSQGAMSAAIASIDPTTVFGYLNQPEFPTVSCQTTSSGSGGRFCCQVANATDANGEEAFVVTTLFNPDGGCSTSGFLEMSGQQIIDFANSIQTDCQGDVHDSNSGRNQLDTCVVIGLSGGSC